MVTRMLWRKSKLFIVFVLYTVTEDEVAEGILQQKDENRALCFYRYFDDINCEDKLACKFKFCEFSLLFKVTMNENCIMPHFLSFIQPFCKWWSDVTTFCYVEYHSVEQFKTIFFVPETPIGKEDFFHERSLLRSGIL